MLKNKKKFILVFISVIILFLVVSTIVILRNQYGKRMPENFSKKGIQLRTEYIDDAIDLNVKWGLVNFSTSLLTEEPGPYYIEYKGNVYYFVTGIIEQLDEMLGELKEHEVSVVASFVNEKNDEYSFLRYPAVDDDRTMYYAFNTADEKARECVEAYAEFFVNRYSAANNGCVTAWCIGNEVNDNLQYHNMGPCDMQDYVKAYYDEFRLFYDVIKKYDKGADVYIPLEHRWQTANTLTDYGGRWFLEYFHVLEEKQGEMDWGVAWHPYPYPLGDPDTLDDGDYPTIDTDGSPSYGGEVTLEYTTPLISMKNIDILTDYFKDNLHRKDGKVRSIILSEVGYTSRSVIVGDNEAKQAANIAYAYYKADANPYIKALIIRAHADEDEGSLYFRFGLRYSKEDGGRKKIAYDVYKYAGTSDGKKYDPMILSILGADRWEDVIPGYRGDEYGDNVLTSEDDAGTNVAEERKKEISECVISVPESVKYTGRPIIPKVIVQRDNIFLEEGRDYNISVTGNVLPGTAVVTVVGLGEYSGYTKKTFEIEGEYAPILDPAWYFDHCPEAKDACGDDFEKAEEYYFSNDIKNGVRASEEFDVFYYLANYPELEDKFGDDYEAACMHYIREGKNEGLIASKLLAPSKYRGVDYSLVYDQAYLVMNRPDIWEACGKNEARLLKRFVERGMDEGVRGSEWFDPVIYRDNNADLKETYGDDIRSYYIHFINEGYREKRISSEHNPKDNTKTVFYGTDYSDVFNAKYYRSKYSDVAEYAGRDSVKALEHFVLYGMAEGRQGNESFDPVMYRALYSDVREAFAEVMGAYYIHYVANGKTEGRFTSVDVLTD